MLKIGSLWLMAGPQGFSVTNAGSNGADTRNSIVLSALSQPAYSGRTRMIKILASVSSTALVLLSTIAPAVAEGDAALGQKAFQRCSACHSTTDQKKAGPGLGGVIGRAAGSVEGVRYSAAMKASGLVWDEATLDRFLAAPREVVPKTTMSIGVPKPEDRQNIIAYLKSLSQ